MAKKPRKSKNLDRWVRNNQNKHLCGCGCGEYIVVKRSHSKPSVGIPKFIQGHNLKTDEEGERPLSKPIKKESQWDRLSPEEQQRRLNQLKNFEEGENNPSWKGGRRLDENGYIQIRINDHPFAKDGYFAEHRLVVEERTREQDPNNPLLVMHKGKKYLKQSAIVHHMDECKTNNDSSNLMLLPRQKYHSFIHYSPLPMEERLIRISKGISHSRELTEQEKGQETIYKWLLDYI